MVACEYGANALRFVSKLKAIKFTRRRNERKKKNLYKDKNVCTRFSCAPYHTWTEKKKKTNKRNHAYIYGTVYIHTHNTMRAFTRWAMRTEQAQRVSESKCVHKIRFRTRFTRFGATLYTHCRPHTSRFPTHQRTHKHKYTRTRTRIPKSMKNENTFSLFYICMYCT